MSHGLRFDCGVVAQPKQNPEPSCTCPARFCCCVVLCCLQVERCVSLLMESGRLPEAALFARSYAPSLMKQPLQVGWETEGGSRVRCLGTGA